MFTGVDFKKAIKFWEQGREVLVLDRASKSASGSGYDTFDFSQLFENVEFLADVPAVETPEFGPTVSEMEEPTSKGEKGESTPPSEKPEGSRIVLPAGKTNKDIALELAGQGLSASEIAKQTGMKYNTVYYYLNPGKCGKKADVSKLVPGHNSDRHLCKTCRYRNAAKSPKNGCDYAAIVRHSRGCEVEDCDKYEKGSPVSKRKQAGFYGNNK